MREILEKVKRLDYDYRIQIKNKEKEIDILHGQIEELNKIVDDIQQLGEIVDNKLEETRHMTTGDNNG